ncbi:MAG: UDP-2,3-diacylglucosamine diphosphatase LpxI [Elusimicrobia bacterium]|nr:UDP-2,3-diacylglucosamine diphosphatase LpxI [Elusimicrobiota bacterium]MDE2510299.1 UDP-2,3-diacylglucosamine diphosphatase LpxI [Elusimicrobiota bacterium]
MDRLHRVGGQARRDAPRRRHDAARGGRRLTEPLGLVAGSGRFPLLVAEEAKRRGVPVVALGIPGVTDEALARLVDRLTWFKLGQIDAPIKALKDAGVRKVVMAGKVQHVSLFGGVLPDWRAAKVLLSLKDKRTDTVLKAVVDEFAKDGLEFISSASYLEHLLAPNGALTKRGLTKDQLSDAALGWRAAKAVAGFDIGQTVVVQSGAIVAVEGMEGTDACVKRAAELARSQGREPALVVVKVAKPRQDFRFDLPVVGLDSLVNFKNAGVKALALETGATLIFDRDRFAADADAAGLAVAGYPPEGPIQ